MTVLIINFPFTSAFYDGLTRVPAEILDLAKTMGGAKPQLSQRIQIPHALPSLGTGLKLPTTRVLFGAAINE